MSNPWEGEEFSAHKDVGKPRTLGEGMSIAWCRLLSELRSVPSLVKLDLGSD